MPNYEAVFQNLPFIKRYDLTLKQPNTTRNKKNHPVKRLFLHHFWMISTRF